MHEPETAGAFSAGGTCPPEPLQRTINPHQSTINRLSSANGCGFVM